MSDNIRILPDQIDLFDESKVGFAARRLAASFNIAARAMPQDDNPLPEAQKLFLSTTGLNAVPAFNKDEVNYLRMQLIETAAIMGQGRNTTLEEIREAGKALFVEAQLMNLIRPEIPHEKHKGPELGCGAEGM